MNKAVSLEYDNIILCQGKNSANKGPEFEVRPKNGGRS